MAQFLAYNGVNSENKPEGMVQMFPLYHGPDACPGTLASDMG
jgi:hypothetical protein